MRVVFFTRYREAGGSSRTRAYQYLQPLAQQGIRAGVISRLTPEGRVDPEAFPRVLEAASAGARVILQKPNLTSSQLAQLQQASEGGFAVDFDDAIWMGYGPGDPPEGIESLHATLSQARLITVGSQYLAEWAEKRSGAPVRVLPPSVYPSSFLPRVEEGGTPLALWIGSSGNFPDLQPIRAPLLHLLRAGKLRLKVIADQPLPSGEWPGAEWAEWSVRSEAELLSRGWLGLTPLQDNPRSRARCAYKSVQYGAAGLPVLASPVGGGREVVRAGVSALLPRSESEWLAALTLFGGDRELGERMGAAGRDWICQHHSIPLQAARLAGWLREFLQE